MLFFLVSCFSFILVSKSLSLRPKSKSNAKSIGSDWNLFSPWFWKELLSFLVSWFQKGGVATKPSKKKKKEKSFGSRLVTVVEEEKVSLLDLPDLTLDYILENLPPAGLCNMARVCSSLRYRCTSDHLWERHMKHKWGRVIGDAAYREWQWHLASRQRSSLTYNDKHTGFFSSWSFSWVKSKSENNCEPISSLPIDSIMAWYVSLESGKFWFPAQVYSRENGHAGFMLSCYDAQLSYDSRTDTFRARYSPHGRRMVEENISWDRLRAPPVKTPSHVLHISDCLHCLKTGDHIEIQWRRNKEFPYGWWYGVVGHLESCDRSASYCLCLYHDLVVLEFNQYPRGSRWRQIMINRKDHREVGNEADGFYGGIRKVCKSEEISMWKSLWPSPALE